MRVMILGGAGMLGHKMCEVLSRRFDVYVTLRRSVATYSRYGIFDPARAIEGVDAFSFDSIVRAMANVKPQVVINGIGAVKQLTASADPFIALTVNALLPHRVAQLCRAVGARFIQISTDCVFSGRKGNYTEEDESDATDPYGRTKFLGEVTGERCLTIRTSIIGRELGTDHGLVEWFLRQKGGIVNGYTNAIFSGFTTQVLSEIIGQIISQWPDLGGLYHVASRPIRKHDLLLLLRDAFDMDVEIRPSHEFVADRSLDGTKFSAATGFVPPEWRTMVWELARCES